MARSTRSPARLVVALSVAALLAVFLLYTSVAGGSTPSLKPSQLAGHTGKVSVAGVVVKPVRGDSHSVGGLRFGLRDIGGKGRLVQVVYRGESPPPMFRAGRDVVVTGRYANGAVSGTALVTKCPSKYAPATKKS